MFAEHLLQDVGLHWPSIAAAQAGQWARRQFAQVLRGLCALRGHNVVLHCEPRRLSVRCIDCDWESPGWTIEKPSDSRARAVDPPGR